MVQAIYRMIAQADGSLMLARRGIGAAQSLIERAGFFDGMARKTQTRSPKVEAVALESGSKT